MILGFVAPGENDTLPRAGRVSVWGRRGDFRGGGGGRVPYARGWCVFSEGVVAFVCWELSVLELISNVFCFLVCVFG